MEEAGGIGGRVKREERVHFEVPLMSFPSGWSGFRPSRIEMTWPAAQLVVGAVSCKGHAYINDYFDE